MRNKQIKSKITFFLTVKQIEQGCLLSIYAKENIVEAEPKFSGISAEVLLPLPEVLFEKLTTWQAAYNAYYGERKVSSPPSPAQNDQAPRSRLTIRRQEGKQAARVDTKAFLQQAETSLKNEFTTWLESQENFPIYNFIRKKIGIPDNFYPDQNFTPDFDEVNILVDCQGDKASHLRQLPWSTWEVINPDWQTETGIFLNILQTSYPIKKKVVPYLKPQSRILILVGDDPFLKINEIKEIAQQLDKERSIFVEFLEARAYPSQTDYLKQVRFALVDNRYWDALFVISHGGEGNDGGQLRFSSEIQFSIAEIAKELSIACENGLRFALLNCCSGSSVAEFLISNGLHQVYAFGEKINHESLKKIFLLFTQSLINQRSVKEIHQDILKNLQAEEQSFPSLALVPELFQYPDIEVSDFCIEVAPLKHFIQTIKPKNKTEILVMTIVLFLSMTWPMQDLLTDVRFLVQAIARTALLGVTNQESTPPKIQLITIDQKTINQQRRENYPDLEEQPIDRRLVADILDNLNQLNPEVIGINYLLANQTQYGAALSNSINEIQINTLTTERPWLTFVSDVFRHETPNSVFFDAQTSLSADGNFIMWDLGKPDNLNCESQCPFSFRLAQTYQLRELLSVGTVASINESVEQDRTLTLQDIVDDYYLESVLTPNSKEDQTISAFDIRLSDRENSSLWQQLWSSFVHVIAPYSLVDYSQPPNLVYDKMSAQDFLDWSSVAGQNQAFKEQFQDRIVIITADDYPEVSVNNTTLPLAKRYWCSQYINKNISQRILQLPPSQCARSLTTGKIQAYKTYHYLNQYNLRQISFFWTTVLGIIVAKGLQYRTTKVRIRSHQKKQANSFLILTILNIINVFVLMAFKISIPLSLASGIIIYYIRNDLKSNNHDQA